MPSLVELKTGLKSVLVYSVYMNENNVLHKIVYNKYWSFKK
jgi:hypothetical protein